MQWLKQSTAVTLKIGPFIDETDGKTAETALTIAQADVRLSKNGGDIAQKNESTSCTHDELGIYGCPIDTTDTATLGRLQLWVHESGALPVWHEFMVVPANVWDSMFGSDMLKVDVHAIDDDETAANNLESYCDGTTPQPVNATQISADATAADNLELITEIANITSLTVDAAGHLEADVVEIEGADPTDTINAAVDAALNTAIPGSPAAHSINQRIKALDELTEASGNGDLAAILGDTNELQTDDIPAKITALNDPTAAAIRTEIDSNSTQLAAIVADTNELQTDDIPGKIAALNDPTAAAIADAVLDEALSAHDTEDTVGNVLNDLTEESSGTYRFTSAALQSTLGAGAITFTYTLTSSVDSAPIASATVWVTTDQAGNNVVASGTTDTSGEVTFYLDAGTYYVWREKAGWNFTNPDTETVA